MLITRGTGGSGEPPLPDFVMKPSPMEKTAREIAARLRENGHMAYFAGGCVRDMVRGLTPKDYDIATDARPEAVQKLFPRTYAVGAHFGVIIVLENGFQFEVATFLDYKIDNGTWKALVANAPSINQISAERIRDELVRVLTSPNRVRGWDLLDSSGLMRVILPEIDAMKGCLQPEQFHPEGDVFQHTRLMLQFLPEKVSVPLVFSVVLHDVAKPRAATVDETGRIRFSGHDRLGAEMTEEIMRRLRFSGAEMEATVEMVRQHMVCKDVPKMRVAKLKRFMARPTFEDELELHRVDCEGSHRMLDNYEFLLRKREEFANEPVIPLPLVRGDDLIALGLKPGPKFGEILEAAETQQLEGKLRTREEALEWVRREYSLGRTAEENIE